MKRVIILATALLCTVIPAQAAGVFTKNELESSPQAELLDLRLQILNRMSDQLSHVRSTASADAAAPRLLHKMEQFQKLQEAAEIANGSTISRASRLRYLQQMEQAMNAFRLACLRVVQEDCYGSTVLRQAMGKISQSF